MKKINSLYKKLNKLIKKRMYLQAEIQIIKLKIRELK